MRERHLAIGVPVGAETDPAIPQLVSSLLDRVAGSDPEKSGGQTPTVIVARPILGGEPEPVRTAGHGRLIERQYAPKTQDGLELPYHGQVGRARAIHAILTEAQATGADGCIIVDPRSVGSLAWLDEVQRALARQGVDFVSGVYSRHPFGSGLVHGVLAPLFAASYGVRLQYPVTPQFGCSSRFVASLLDHPFWDTAEAQVGIEWWLAATAASGGFQIGEAAGGVIRDGRPLVDLSTLTAQLVGFAFTDLERQARLWQRSRASKAPVALGEPVTIDPAPHVDAVALAESFRSAYRDLREVWEEVMPPLSMLQWRRLTTVSQDAFAVSDAVWARTLYDFAMGHRLRVIPRADLLHSLTPLYLAWLASFVLEMDGTPPSAVRARLERLRATFETEKPYFVSQWRWPERFKPVKLRRQPDGSRAL